MAKKLETQRGFAPRDSLRECIAAGKQSMNWDNKWHQAGTKTLPNGKMHGLGFIWTYEWGAAHGIGAVSMRVAHADRAGITDGTVTIYGMLAECGTNGCDIFMPNSR